MFSSDTPIASRSQVGRYIIGFTHLSSCCVLCSIIEEWMVVKRHIRDWLSRISWGLAETAWKHRLRLIRTGLAACGDLDHLK